jgi:hypothetical protein
MNIFLVHSVRILLGTLLLMILWMISLQAAEFLIPSQLETSQEPGAIFFYKFMLVCLIHVILLYFTIRLSRWYGYKLIVVIFLLIFIIQYLLGMVEAVWFNDRLQMPLSGIQSIVLSGFILSLLFSPLIVWIGSGFTLRRNPDDYVIPDRLPEKLLAKTVLLAVLIYPALYFLAGYYIAWQFEPVRLFYTGSAEMESFGKMMWENFRSGLYFFQIMRGIIWVGVALPVYVMTRGAFWQRGILIGLLFALLMNAQHLIPNPYFPVGVTAAHFVETASSNFIWGFIIALIFDVKVRN